MENAPHRRIARDLALLLLGGILTLVLLGAVVRGGCCLVPLIGPL